jgi:phage gpG-like protein
MATVQKKQVRSELVEDPQFLGAVFQDIENKFNEADYGPDLEKYAVPEITADHAQYFERRADPSGTPWQPLSPVTIAKKGFDQPLVETNAMRTSLLDPNHPEHIGGTANRGLNFGTSDEKASIHQKGAGRIPARPFVGISEQRVDYLANLVADSLIEQLKG